MRILLLNESARRHNGGMNRVVVETCDWLARSGHTVQLGYSDGGSAEVGCPTTTILAADPVGSTLRVAEAFAPDVIQLHHALEPEVFAALSARWPLTIFQHDQTWFCAGGDRADSAFESCHRPHGLACLFWNYAQGCGGRHPVGNWRRWQRTQGLLRLKTLARARIQVASRFMQRGLEENGFDLNRVDVLPLFAEPPPAEGAVERGLILLPSRLVRPKGVGVALEAMAQLQSHAWRLVVAGDGLQREEFRSQAVRLGIGARVEFLGELSPGALSAWYARAQLVLFPVLRREPFGLIGVESLAYGKPIVAFAGGAVEEWLWPGETGLRVEDRTPEAFAAAVRQLLIAPIRCEEMGRAARQRYAFFHPSAYLERLVAAFERTIRWHRETVG